MCVKPWTPWSMMGLKGLTTATNLTVDFLPYSGLMIAISFTAILLFVVAGKFIIRVDVTKLKDVDFTTLGEKIDYNTQQKFATALLLLIVLALYLPSTLSKDLWIYAILSKLGAVGVITGITVILCFVRFQGEPAINFGKLAAKSIPWPMVCLLASVGPMGTALMHSEAGITKMVLGLMKPIFAGQSPMMIYILV